jgi:hypothetical protein
MGVGRLRGVGLHGIDPPVGDRVPGIQHPAELVTTPIPGANTADGYGAELIHKGAGT